MSQEKVKKIELNQEMATNLFEQQKQILNNLVNRKKQVEQQIMSFEATINNLNGLEENKEKEGMMSLGNGIFVEIKYPSKLTEVKYSIGSNVVINKKVKDVISDINTKKDALKKEYSVLSKKEAELTDNLNKLYMFLTNASKKANKKE